MPFDTLMMKVVTGELQERITGAKVRRVYEPGRMETILELYTRGGRQDVFFSIDSRHARVHPAGEQRQGLKKPSPFCMLLRKYLVGGRVRSVHAPELERILEIDFEPPEGMPPVKLIAEIMGRRSNLVLVGADDVIIGAARPVSWEKNPLRAILPGEVYRPVPPQERLNPLDMDRELFSGRFLSLLEKGTDPEKALLGTVGGTAPLTARELLARAGWDDRDQKGSAGRLFEKTVGLFRAGQEGLLQPVHLPGRQLYAAMPLEHLPGEEQVGYDRPGAMLERFHDDLAREERVKQLQQKLGSAVKRRLDRLRRKKREQEKELETARDAHRLRLYGELLLACGHLVEPGTESAVLPDLYNPGQTVTVPLDPSRTVSDNAQKHFRNYRKAKKGQDKINRELKKTRSEISYCRGLQYALENSDEVSLEEIERELIAAGYLRERGKEREKAPGKPRPLRFQTSSGHTVLVGRNNRQNDFVTFEAAVRRDTWFHARDLPGGHVVLKEAPSPPPEQDIEEAAFLAAYFSRGRDSGAVAVDYTGIRHVRRRPGGRPGFVFYENFQTITVNPGNKSMRSRFGL